MLVYFDIEANRPSCLCRNWDFVGNDIPVFFIRDGIKFVDLVHALKPSPRKHVQEGWRILDFLSHHPESCHIGSRTLPVACTVCALCYEFEVISTVAAEAAGHANGRCACLQLTWLLSDEGIP